MVAFFQLEVYLASPGYWEEGMLFFLIWLCVGVLLSFLIFVADSFTLLFCGEIWQQYERMEQGSDEVGFAVPELKEEPTLRYFGAGKLVGLSIFAFDTCYGPIMVFRMWESCMQLRKILSCSLLDY